MQVDVVTKTYQRHHFHAILISLEDPFNVYMVHTD
jgi:hypothetical protein